MLSIIELSELSGKRLSRRDSRNREIGTGLPRSIGVVSMIIQRLRKEIYYMESLILAQDERWRYA